MSQNVENKIHQTIIIGSGPAGYTAAIYAARANMEPIIITGMQPGGQLTTTTEVENFPGYPNGITGPEMMVELQQQAERFGTQVIFDMVTQVEFDKSGQHIHKVRTANGQEFSTRSIIISTGASAKYLGLEDETKYAGSGVSACATCDGFFYRGKDVAVIGGGDTAAEEATYLAKLCRKVYLLVRKEEMRASKVMQERVFKTPNLELMYNHELIGLEGDGVVEKAIIYNNQTEQQSQLQVDGVFIAIGHKPNTDLFVGMLDMDANGYLLTRDKTTHTNVPGVFACGDVQDHIYRQAVTAAGSGCMAALDAERYVAELEAALSPAL
ncbi:MAG: thioredoxin-disulfide reductase [Weeksellaceae bacterium]|nr:thioredoxin-disulfide reductase [Weeksellaceae bacterium]